MSPSDANRAASQIGLLTLALGGALALAPVRVGNLAGMQRPGDARIIGVAVRAEGGGSRWHRDARIIGVADLALVPGLLWGRTRRPWMTGLIGLNLAIIGYLLTVGSSG